MLDVQPLAEWRAEHCVAPPLHEANDIIWCALDGTMHCANAAREQRWERSVFGELQPLQLRERPIVVDGRLLAKLRKRVICLDRHSGEVRWQCEVTDSIDLNGAIAFGDELLCHGVEKLLAPPHLYRLDLATGNLKRLYERRRIGFSLAVVDGTLVTLERDCCVAVDLQTGEERWATSVKGPPNWRYEQGSPPAGQPMLYGDLVIVPVHDFGLMAVRISDGAIAWRTKLAEGGMANAVLHGDHVELVDSHYVKVRARDGNVVTSNELGSRLRALGVRPPNRLAFAGAVGFAVDDRGVAIAYDTSADAILWHQSLGADVPYACEPAVAHGRLWIMDVKGGLHVFQLPGGLG